MKPLLLITILAVSTTIRLFGQKDIYLRFQGNEDAGRNLLPGLYILKINTEDVIVSTKINK